MKNFLIKIGKIKSILERDGFWSGTKHISEKGWRLLKEIINFSRGDIVFVSSGVGDSAVYRTKYVAEELRLYGLKARVVYFDDPFLFFKTKKAKIIILHKTTCSGKVKAFMQSKDRAKQTIIYDTDDLMFDAERFKKTDAYHNFNELQRKQYEDGVGLKILKSKQVKAISTTTTFLAEKLKQFGKPVYVVKNKLAKRELRWAREARKIYLSRVKRRENVRLGYFSGSVSHNRDFATIVPALEIILKQHPRVRLYLVGYLDLNDKFYKKFQKQIIQLPFVPRKKHYQNIAQVDINLAPLEMNDFCQAKSELKFFEAGIIGIPTIAVRNKTFSEVIDERVDGLKESISCLNSKRSGLLAGNTNEWVQKLELLINDKGMRKNIGERARQVVLKKYLTSSGDNKKYYKFLEDIIENNRPPTKSSS
jgi:hypothetical protein